MLVECSAWGLTHSTNLIKWLFRLSPPLLCIAAIPNSGSSGELNSLGSELFFKAPHLSIQLWG